MSHQLFTGWEINQSEIDPEVHSAVFHSQDNWSLLNVTDIQIHSEM